MYMHVRVLCIDFYQKHIMFVVIAFAELLGLGRGGIWYEGVELHEGVGLGMKGWGSA